MTPIRLYVAPKLEKFGTFRQLTRGQYPGKVVIGDDLVPAVGGLDCDPNTGPPTGCIRS